MTTDLFIFSLTNELQKLNERSNCCALKPFALSLVQLTEVWRGSYLMENAFSSLTEAYHLWFQFYALV